MYIHINKVFQACILVFCTKSSCTVSQTILITTVGSKKAPNQNPDGLHPDTTTYPITTGTQNEGSIDSIVNTSHSIEKYPEDN
jgi:hypothetical protein